MRRLFKARHEHPDEADGRESRDCPDCFLEVGQGNLELIPLDGLFSPVARRYYRYLFVRYVVFTHFQIFRADGDSVLVVTFIFVEGVVEVDVLHVGVGAR